MRTRRISRRGWRARARGSTGIRGLRANAPKRSHAEFNEAPDLDAGDPVELGGDYGAMVRRLPQINVLGGCCGTHHRYIERICAEYKAAEGA